MQEHNITPNNFLDKRQGKDKIFVLKLIIQTIEKNTGKSILTLQNEMTKDGLFFECLKHITTTKKALCEAVGIPIEAGCRFKREFEKNGLLVESKDDFICPFTKHKAKLISTNPNEFEKLNKSKSDNQLKLF